MGLSSSRTDHTWVIGTILVFDGDHAYAQYMYELPNMSNMDWMYVI